LGSTHEARCVRCGLFQSVAVGGGMTFSIAYCTHCGQHAFIDHPVDTDSADADTADNAFLFDLDSFKSPSAEQSPVAPWVPATLPRIGDELDGVGEAGDPHYDPTHSSTPGEHHHGSRVRGSPCSCGGTFSGSIPRCARRRSSQLKSIRIVDDYD
jgi:hypothetical protein